MRKRKLSTPKPPSPTKEKYDAAIAAQCLALGLPLPLGEQYFALAAMKRRWQFDYLWPDYHFAEGLSASVEVGTVLEVNGGIWAGGRHTTGAGFARDMAKLNAATILGYSVIQVTPQQLFSGLALDLVRRTIELRSGKNLFAGDRCPLDELFRIPPKKRRKKSSNAVSSPSRRGVNARRGKP